MSWVKYTFTRCPSRMVMVGGICMKRSRIVVADCETLADAPVVNDLRTAAGKGSATLFDLRCPGDDA